MSQAVPRRFRKPTRLHPGDRIAIVSPSWGGPSQFPLVYEKGLRVLREQLQLEPVEFPTARMDAEQLRLHPEVRAADLNAAFADRSIAGIISSIGGDDSVRILEHLDAKTIRANPKLIMGYSDFTTLLAYLNFLGNVTFHGPSVMAGIAQAAALGSDYLERLKGWLLTNPASRTYRGFDFYVNGCPDWAVAETVGEVNPPNPSAGWHWLQTAGTRQAYFWGGNIEVLEFMKGTDYWPERQFFEDKFLLLETSEEVPPPLQVERFLRNYGTQTILRRIQGLVVGRPRGYSDKQKSQLEAGVRRIVVEEQGRTDIPIILDFDIGHTDPQLVVPFGIRAEIDSESGSVELVEAVFKER